MSNRLAGASSPYLLQHANNPVDWQPWDAAALAQARAEDKPILLSIGYAACHWCHVMAHESFEDAATAAVMNRLFVNIKVDREERPDLDQIYQHAQQLLTGRTGGWPLTLFLTPDGTPFHGGTYFPKQPRYGLPGFVALCERIGELWRTRRADIAAQNRELLAALNRPPTPPAEAAQLDPAPVAALRALLLGSFDPVDGGFGGAPKFPHPTELAFLLGRRNDPAARAAALHTLRRMAAGGIHDQLGGGFFRYSVDAQWEIPHFEKMLYDNALLLGVYAEAWAASGESEFLDVATGIVAWLQGEMTSLDGAFHSSLDADAEGEEGRFYVWTRDEVAALLAPAESALAGRRWGLDQPPNFEGRWHLRVLAPLAPEETELAARASAKLLAARNRRPRPGCDDKILTSWNALTIEALARAARLCDRPAWLAAARRAHAFLRERHWQGDRLRATSRGGPAQLDAYLDDYAFLLAATLELERSVAPADDLPFARQLAERLLADFEDPQDGGFFFTAHDHETLIQRPKPAHDTALPAGNGIAARALWQLGERLDEERFRSAARRTVAAFLAAACERPAGMTSLIAALDVMTDVNPPACDGVTCFVPPGDFR